MSTKENGLQVVCNQYWAIRAFVQNAPGTAPVNPIVTTWITCILDPLSIYQDLVRNVTSPSRDFKFFWRQMKTTGYVTSTGNMDIFLLRTSFRFRKDVATADYPTYQAILDDQAPSSSTPYIPYTMSNTAQRLLKFGKTKVMHFRPGQTKRYKLSMKYFSPKQMSVDKEANTLYLGTRITKGYIFQVLPPPAPMQSVNGAAPVSVAVGSYNVLFNETSYGSYYVNGVNDPSAKYYQSATPTQTIVANVYPFGNQNSSVKSV